MIATRQHSAVEYDEVDKICSYGNPKRNMYSEVSETLPEAVIESSIRDKKVMAQLSELLIDITYTVCLLAIVTYIKITQRFAVKSIRKTRF